MDLINQTQITVGDYAYAGTWSNPLNGAPSITAKIRTITNEPTPREMGDKGDITITLDPDAVINPNGQEISNGQGETIIVSGLPPLTQAQFYLYFRALVYNAMEAPIVVEEGPT
jgi:hypothetical protein